jgi:hypothetical protein
MIQEGGCGSEARDEVRAGTASWIIGCGRKIVHAAASHDSVEHLKHFVRETWEAGPFIFSVFRAPASSSQWPTSLPETKLQCRGAVLLQPEPRIECPT